MRVPVLVRSAPQPVPLLAADGANQRLRLDRLPAPTEWRDRWQWLCRRDLKSFTARYCEAIARQAK